MTSTGFRALTLAVVFLVAVGVASIAGGQDDRSDAFYAAIRANDLARLTTLAAGAGINAKDSGGLTPLMYAAVTGSAEAMQLLLDKGADVNAKNNSESTALMWSATDIRKVRLLLDRKADVHAVSTLGRTALFVAAMSDRSADIVKLLIARGANVKAIDGARMTMLHAATSGNDTETIRVVVAAGLDVNAADFAGFTPLMNAAGHGNLTAVTMLLGKGADVNAVSGDGSFQKVKAGAIALGNFTPLLLASAFGPPDVVNALLAAGARVDVQDVRGMTPLMLAVATDRQNPEIVRALVARKADVNMKSLAGETALDWARKIGRPAGIDLLERAGAVATAPKPIPVPASAPAALTPSIERSVMLLEKTSAGFLSNGGCAACHAQNITDLATGVARLKGVTVNTTAVTQRQRVTTIPFAAGPRLLERLDSPGTPDVALYALGALADTGTHPIASPMSPSPISRRTSAATVAGRSDQSRGRQSRTAISSASRSAFVR